MRQYLAGLVVVVCLVAGCVASGQATFTVEGLRCEYLSNPLGIDVTQPRLSWMLGSGPQGRTQSAYRILVASSPENLRKDRGDLWDSGRTESKQSTFVVYRGRPLASGARCHWKVRAWDASGGASQWSSPAFWSMGLLEESDWYGRWIGEVRPAGAKEGTPLPFPWLRKTVELKQKPQRATAYVNALGYYELYINGKKVDDHVLSPAVSDYSKRNYYVTQDVTDYLVKGRNCVALWLGRGWYVRGHPGVIHDGPLVRAQVDISFSKGSSVKVGTDATWKVRESYIRPLGRGTAFGDYGGEHFDARYELPNWNSPGLDDSGWQAAAVFDVPRVITAAQMVEPNRIMRTLAAVKVEEPAPGVWQIDMGRNYTGWFELRLPGSMAPGKLVRIEYADAPPVGNRFMTANQRDEYVTRDAPGQTIRGRFNYHAFRFARVTGLERQPSLEDAKGYHIRTAYEPAADFESSNELLNRIYQTTTWTYQCLTLGGYVVDCPHRERLGYGGDAGTSIETGLFNFDTGGLYNRWSANWRDAQAPNGDLPYTAPAYPDQGGGGPMWSGFCVTLPWHLYLQYGDRRILEISYPTIQKWLAFAESKSVDNILEPYVSYGIRMPQWNYLGDWVTPKRATGGPRDPQASRFINNCYLLYNLQLAGKIAAILGRSADASAYEGRAATLKRVLHERFFDAAGGVYTTGEQPYLAIPLLLKVVPEDLSATVARKLEETIRTKNQGHIDAGMHGAYFLLKYLIDEDRNDLIYEMATKTTYPSWGYMLEQGATTVWENWSGGSHIHDTLISIGSWFIQGIGGIRIDEQSPGFTHFLLSPAVVGDLKFARTRYRSIHGMIVSNWRVEDGTLHLDVTVPGGTTATLYVPAASPETVMEGGRPVAQSAGIRFGGTEKGKVLFHLNPGQYQFTARR